MLPDDVARCLGVWRSPKGDVFCTKREECARYIHRETGGKWTPAAAWLCPTPDDFYGAFLPVKEEAPLPEKINEPPSAESAPTVNIRSVEGDTVEEYRVNGRLTMVKVRPKNGAEYTLVDSNGDGKLDRRDSEGPVAPVYWTLYEWN